MKVNTRTELTALRPGAGASAQAMTGPEPALKHPAATASYEVVVARTGPELEALRPAWESLNRNPNAQIDFFQLINAARPAVLRPHVIALRQDGEITGLVVGRVVEKDFTCFLGYKTFTFGKIRQLDVVHGGWLGISGEADAERAIRELLAALDRREVEAVYLSHVPAGSEVYRLARRQPRLLCRDRVLQTQLHRKARLPRTLEEFLGRLNKKHRAWSRRMEKLLQTDFPGEVRYQNFGGYPDLGRLADDLEAIAGRTYQRELGAGFARNSEQLQRLALARKHDWLRGGVLHVKDRPCAFWMGSLYRGVFYSEATGYDSEFRKYEVGTQVFLRLVADLCAEGVREIDFGLGDAQYKKRFGDEQWDEGSVWMFGPTLRGRGLNLLRTSLEGPALAAKRALNALGLEQRLKTLWRRKLMETPKS